MRAITVSRYGAPPTLTEVPEPRPGPRELLIRVHVAGVNSMNRRIADGALESTMPAHFPLVLGADLAGDVAVDRADATERLHAYGAAETVDGASVSVAARLRRGFRDRRSRLRRCPR